MAARLITLEGGEGCGKSTQARLLADALAGRGLAVLRTREPGGAPGAEFLRGVLLDGALAWSAAAEALLHFAARAEHVERSIRPALAAGMWVVCDRFYDSTMAYQGFGQSAGRDRITTLAGRDRITTLAGRDRITTLAGRDRITTLAGRDRITTLTGLIGIVPDITLVLEADPDLIRQRLAARAGTPDRYERLDAAFHARVHAGFRAIAAENPDRCVTIDANGSIRSVHAEILRALDRRFSDLE